MTFMIRKASGEIEPFVPEKIERSLRKIGTPESLIEEIVQKIKKAPEIATTRDVYQYVSNYLKTVNRPLASRYNLKNALYQLGPEGFFFEKFVAELFRAQGYEAVNDKVLKGSCVDHEIDVIAFKEDMRNLVECKFHNSPGIKTDVKVALYIKARFEDVKTSPVAYRGIHGTCNKAWLATNTKFTIDAITYAQCSAMGLIGWAYPEKTSIETIVDSHNLYPITCLVSLSYYQKKKLLEQGMLLCKELEENYQSLVHIGLSIEHAQQVQAECKALSPLTSHV